MTEQTKPREFWLNTNTNGYSDSPMGAPVIGAVHVIEYSALLAAQADLQSARAENAELKAKLKTAVEALESLSKQNGNEFAMQELAKEALDKIKAD